MSWGEAWYAEHPEFNNRPLLDNLRSVHPGTEIWVGDAALPARDEAVTLEAIYSQLLVAGSDCFTGRPILPSSVMA